MVNGLGQTVDDAIVELEPSKDNSREYDYQVDLAEWLQQYLQGPAVVDRNHGDISADIAVEDRIGIELKNNLSKRQTKDLGDEIEEYASEYEHVFVVACGVEDTAGWNRHIQDYETDGGVFGMGGVPIWFVEK